MGFFAKLGAGWLRIARAMGETQTFVLLSLLYGLVIGPMALLLVFRPSGLFGRR